MVAELEQSRTCEPARLSALVTKIIDALEQSPAPKYEWPALVEVLGLDLLVRLLGISESSARRYLSGERVTPDPVAARLHFVALVVGDLAGAYNEIGEPPSLQPDLPLQTMTGGPASRPACRQFARTHRGNASSVSAWVNAAMADKSAHRRRLKALDEAIADYEAEFGPITDEELEEQRRLDKTAAKQVRAEGIRRRAQRELGA